ncbi:MAG TPA: hypothetical protein VMU19_12595, partial [Bryobacteraceae bacterium]|nr:hypothetical protein [Bryobacteraceae bacterium]
MTPGILRRASMLAFVGGLVPLSVWGTTLASGTTVSAVAGDDNNYSTTTDVTFQTYCSWIVNGMGQAPFNANGNLPVAFAGYGVAADVPNISSADLSVSSYAPWVVNNNGNAGGNGIVAPDGTNYNRSLTGVEGGGANIVLTYTPTSDFDPTSVNFIQAYIENVNGGAFTTGTIDSTSNSAYYNDVGVFGIGDTTG